jgi:hypothetical protein
MRRARYRVGQFFRHLRRAPLSPAEQAEAVQALASPALVALFARHPPSEQAHAVRVLRAVSEGGHPYAGQIELKQAALLHDIGKTVAPLNVAERTAAVLAGRFFPRQASAWARGKPRGWRKALAVAAQHPAWGADLCAQAGAPPLTVALVRRHQIPILHPLTREDELLGVLQAADDDA